MGWFERRDGMTTDIAALERAVSAAEQAVLSALDDLDAASNLRSIGAAAALAWGAVCSRRRELETARAALRAAGEAAQRPRLRGQREFMGRRILWDDQSTFEYGWNCVKARDAEWLAAIRALANQHFEDTSPRLPEAARAFMAAVEALTEAK
jgi:hypothetical protein